jgi:hypothetical protein
MQEGDLGMEWLPISTYPAPGIRGIFADSESRTVFAGLGFAHGKEIVFWDEDTVYTPSHWIPWPKHPALIMTNAEAEDC